jgi:glycosyltransferase involved in cell wall biosynthesis
MPPPKVFLIPNGVEIKVFTEANQSLVEALAQEWKIRSHTPVIGTLARLHEQKGHSYLLDAVAQLRREIPDVKALVVGDGELRPSLEQRTQALRLSDSVIFTGTRRDVPEILALLDVFVLPSLWEGLPIALLEAMAAGLPVVATRVGGVPEVVVDGETGLLVPPRDPDALSEAILTLLQDPDLRQKMGQAGQERVREYFSVERMVEETEALYERLLAEKGLNR